jgi:hypothetical protein
VGSFRKSELKFCFGHSLESFMTVTSDAFKGIVNPLLRPPLPSPTIYDVCAGGNSYQLLENVRPLPSNHF